MHRLLSTLLVLAWGVWFGAIVMVFVTVTSLFRTFADERTVAGVAAAGVFRSFEMLELVAAPIALVAAIALRRRATGFGASALLVSLLSLTTLGALTARFLITPRIEALRREGVPSSSEQFKILHRSATGVYTSQAFILLGAGLVLPRAIVRRPAADL